MTLTDKIEKIENLYWEHLIPEYLHITNGVVKINVDGKQHSIKAVDVAKYYAYQANSMSGIRKIGSIVGDWRPIDEIASEMLAIFKILSPDRLRREAKKLGLTPKF
jgi:hypothetical protein